MFAANLSPMHRCTQDRYRAELAGRVSGQQLRAVNADAGKGQARTGFVMHLAVTQDKIPQRMLCRVIH